MEKRQYRFMQRFVFKLMRKETAVWQISQAAVFGLVFDTEVFALSFTSNIAKLDKNLKICQF